MILSASGGLFFAKPMRDKMYITMMDPFQIKYGNLLSGALVLPSIMMDLLWVASTLLGLGEHFFCEASECHTFVCRQIIFLVLQELLSV